MFEINFKNYNHKENFLEIVVLDILGPIEETEKKLLVENVKLHPLFYKRHNKTVCAKSERQRK